MDLQTLIIAMSIPSGVTAFCFWMIEQKIKKQQTEAEEKEKEKEKEGPVGEEETEEGDKQNTENPSED